MKYAAEASLSGGAAIGTRRLYSVLAERTDFLVLAEDEESAGALIARSFGEQSSSGGFAFDVDAFHKWFLKIELTRNDSSLQHVINTMMLLQRRLGSITITGASFTFAADALRSFWIETEEEGRTRILTGERSAGEEAFHPLSDDWQFDPPSLAQAIVSQY